LETCFFRIYLLKESPINGRTFFIPASKLTVNDLTSLARGKSMNGVIAALIIALCVIFAFFWAPFVGLVFQGNLDFAQPLRMSDNSVNIEYVTGYAADLGQIRDTTVSNPTPDSQKMGAVSFTMSLNSYRTLSTGVMSVDLDQTIITFTSQSGSEILIQQSSLPIKKPGWTIAKKTGILSFEINNQNNILEPYESFEILILPSIPLPPMSRFLILIKMPDDNQIFISRVVPETITPMMNLN
jgi:hypothetical protein